LQGEEFRAMAEAAPQYLDALAEALNVPRGNMKKLASEGKITTKAVIEATLKMSSMFEEKFSRMPMTIGQATTVMGNRFKTMIAGMNRETQIVTTIANSMLSAFDRIEAGFGRVVDAVGGFSNALKLAGIAVAAILGPLALSGLVTIFGAILSPAGLVVGALIAIGLVIDDLIVYLNGGQSAIGDFLNTLRTDPIMGVLTAVLGFVATLRLLSSGIVVAIARFAALGVAALINGAKIGAGLLLAMGPIGLLIAAFAALAAGIYLVGKNWESIKAFFGFGGAVAPSSIASAGKGGSVVNSNQTVNLTVPPGTPESQQKFLQDAAAKAFESDPLAGLSHNLGMVGP
jgi:phage-related minor tail protein